MKNFLVIIISIVALISLYVSTTVAEELLSYGFECSDDEVVIDSGPNKLNAELVKFNGNVPEVIRPSRLYENCKHGKVLEFDGESMLKVSEFPQVDGSKSFTVMAWIQYTWEGYQNDSETRQEVMEKYDSFWMNIIRTSKVLRVGFQSGKNGEVGPHEDITCEGNKKKVLRKDSTVKIEPKEWTHVAATFDHDSSYIKIFINGEEDEKSKEISSLCYPPINQNPLMIGGRYATDCVERNSCPDAFFKGKINDVQIFWRVYSPAEIKNEWSNLQNPFDPERDCTNLLNPPEIRIIN